MKNTCITMLLCLMISIGQAQTTVTLVADYDCSIGYDNYPNGINQNFNTATQNASYAIPGTGGGMNVNRALIHFDLSSIPANAIITSALLNLYALGQNGSLNGHTGSANQSYLQRVTQPWVTTTVTWNNQPSATTINQVILPGTTQPLLNYTNINVTQMVQDMMASNNYGFMLRLINEVTTNALLFASLNCGVPSKFPTLEITYIFNVTAPPIHCLQVLSNGDVALTWNYADTVGKVFNSYHLWYSGNYYGPYTKFDSIFDYNTLSTIHPGAGANNQSIFYLLTVRYAFPQFIMSNSADTVQTIFLTSQNLNPSAGIGALAWNPTHRPLLPSSTGDYQVFREHPPGVWNQIGITQDTSYLDTIQFCSEWINYKIEISDTLTQQPVSSTFCSSASNISGILFYDSIPPSPPILEVITLDSLTGFPKLRWKQNNGTEITSTIVYLVDGTVFIPLDTINANSSPEYFDQYNPPCISAGGYAITSMDSCGNESLPSQVHKLINLSVFQPYCKSEAFLSWNQYQNMDSGVGAYKIYVSKDGGSASLVSVMGGSSTSFTHSNLDMGSEYCYQIVAVSVDQIKTSNSCIACIKITMPDSLEKPYIQNATVENNQNIKIIIYNNINLPAQEYRLLKSEDGWNFYQIATLPWLAQNPLEYTDLAVNVSQKSYYYQTVSVDLCGTVADSSNVVQTVHLACNPDHQNTSASLIWNDYMGYLGFPTTYEIWRTKDNIPEMIPLITFPPSTGSWTDELSDYSDGNGLISYYLKGIEGSGNPLGLNEITYSNAVTVQLNPKIFIPTAFNPNSPVEPNKVFHPFGKFLDRSPYTFLVFNRFGQLIFKTNDYRTGWDGTLNGIPVPEGVYAWKLEIGIAENEIYTTAGTVTLIR